MRRVSPLQANVPGVLAQDAVNHIRMQRPACVQTCAVVAHRPEEWPLQISAMPCDVEIVLDALHDLWVNRQTPLLAALADDLQRFVSTVHVKVANFQTRDLRASKPDLQAHSKNGAVTN